MTSTSTNSLHKPFLLQPAYKDYLWGGERLKTDYGKQTAASPLAESWECSTHPEGVSTVATGEHRGMSLKALLAEYPQYLGNHSRRFKELPILIKLIDARQNLSVQVHPDDRFAGCRENGQSGKTELWYVLEARPDSRLVYGFYHDMTRAQILKSIEGKNIDKYLQKIKVRKGDVFYVKPGTVHAIGAGIVIAEIQQNSNLTYRLFDYDRTDKQGRRRPLHVRKALEVLKLENSAGLRQPIRLLQYRHGCASELLCRCRYFQVERLLLNTEAAKGLSEIRADSTTFRVLLCVEGCGVLFTEEGESIRFFKGDTIFIPADSVTCRLHGRASFLNISC